MFSFLPPSVRRRLATLLKSWHDELVRDPQEGKRLAAAWQPSSESDSYYRPYRALPPSSGTSGAIPRITTGPMTDPHIQLPFTGQHSVRQQEEQPQENIALMALIAATETDQPQRPFLRYSRVVEQAKHPLGAKTQQHRAVQDTDALRLAALYEGQHYLGKKH